MPGAVKRFDRGEAATATQTSAGWSVTGHIQPAAATAILFVEDEETLLAAVSTMLRKEGFSVIATTDGTAAVNHLRLRADSIGTLILDVVLPGVSSREVLEEARRSRPNIPAIVTSACSQNAVSSVFSGLHIDHVLRKPYRVAALVDLLRGLRPPS
jgi:two-component system cell cycle sensor histidine kinase/response regulator CckA